MVDTTADVVDANGGNCAGMTIAHLPGTDGLISLREAVCAANGTAGPDEITFTDLAGSPDLYTLALAGKGEEAAATGDLDITEELTIQGNGQAETIIQAGTDATNGIDRVFHILRYFAATFEGVTIRYGRATDSGFPNSVGGGIWNDGGTVHLTNSTVSGNTANYGGGIYQYRNFKAANLSNSTVSGNTANDRGGGIYNSSSSTINLNNSTVSGNSANDGGGIYNVIGLTNLNNSTVSSNTAKDSGGGIFEQSSRVNLINSTVSDNSASDGGGIHINGLGTVNLSNSIIANQIGGGDCNCGFGPPGMAIFNSNDYNLDSDNSCNLTQPNDKPSGNANLGPLQVNAPGNTATHALLSGSDAIDTGNDAVCAADPVFGLDQRGVARPQPAGGHCDIGAYELVQYTLTVNTVGNGTVTLVPPGGPGGMYPTGTVVQLTANPASGWTFSGWSGDFSGSTNPASITMDGNKTVTATFVQQTGVIVIEKQTDPDGAPDSFTFSGDANGSIKDGEQIVVGNLAPGTYDSTETVPAGWDLTFIVCDDINSSGDVNTGVATFQLEAGETVKCTFTNTKEPTAITLASFNVEANDGRVMVMWETGTEIDNAGFNLYRAVSEAGPWVKVNQSLIAAEGDPVSGAAYSFVDQPGRGAFYYQLEDLDLSGVTTLHTPVMAQLGPMVRTPWFKPILPDF